MVYARRDGLPGIRLDETNKRPLWLKFLPVFSQAAYLPNPSSREYRPALAGSLPKSDVSSHGALLSEYGSRLGLQGRRASAGYILTTDATIARTEVAAATSFVFATWCAASHCLRARNVWTSENLEETILERWAAAQQ